MDMKTDSYQDSIGKLVHLATYSVGFVQTHHYAHIHFNESTKIGYFSKQCQCVGVKWVLNNIPELIIAAYPSFYCIKYYVHSIHKEW
jgi:hypothetical protein